MSNVFLRKITNSFQDGSADKAAQRDLSLRKALLLRKNGVIP